MKTRAFTRTLAAFALVFVGVSGLTACSTIDELIETAAEHSSPSQQPSSADQPSAPVSGSTGEQDYYTVLGPAVFSYQVAQPGVISYCPLDELGRTVCAYGELTSSLRETAQQRGRQDIDVDPSGWPEGGASNTEVTIPALERIEGSQDYSGWFWNRSHLVADSLGGEATRENLVTGTRTQNVGSHQEQGQYAGGMAYTELLARDYLDAQADDSCPLYYAATPVYHDDAALIPQTVIVDVRACDGQIDQRVEVSNTANGFDIDYTTGAYAQR